MSDLHEEISEIWWSDLDPDDAIEKIIAKVRWHFKNKLVMSEMFNEARNRERAKTVEKCLAAMDNIDWDSEIEEGESLRMVRQAVEIEIKGVGGVCEHGKGLTDYCEPCGRIHGGG